MSRELPGTVWPIMGFSLVSNLLLLVSPLYMLQVYDRILTSGSQDTLIWMTVIAVFLMGIYAAAEIGRRRICALAAERLEEELSERIFENFERRHDAGGRLPNETVWRVNVPLLFPWDFPVQHCQSGGRQNPRPANMRSKQPHTRASFLLSRDLVGKLCKGSIILSRALGPIDQIVGSWRGVAAAQSAWAQILPAISQPQTSSEYTPLPRPEAALKLDRLSVGIPETDAPILRPFMFEVDTPQMIGIIGPNGAGKSSLLQTVSGAWAPHGGAVKLGGRELHNWAAADRGQYVGYLPQDVELLPGTVAENISRMKDVEPENIIAAAKVAGAHEMILALPQGYETQVGVPGIGSLSAGQRQMIGMARALFGKPVLLLLDEPTANLDPASVHQTINRLNAVAKAGTLVVFVKWPCFAPLVLEASVPGVQWRRSKKASQRLDKLWWKTIAKRFSILKAVSFLNFASERAKRLRPETSWLFSSEQHHFLLAIKSFRNMAPSRPQLPVFAGYKRTKFHQIFLFWNP